MDDGSLVLDASLASLSLADRSPWANNTVNESIYHPPLWNYPAPESTYIAPSYNASSGAPTVGTNDLVLNLGMPSSSSTANPSVSTMNPSALNFIPTPSYTETVSLVREVTTPRKKRTRKNRSRNIQSAMSEEVAWQSALRTNRCPVCSFALKGQRAAEFERHVASHFRSSHSMLCAGRWVPEPVNALSYQFEGEWYHGGCLVPFCRLDSLKRHCLNDNNRCVFEENAPYNRDAIQRCQRITGSSVSYFNVASCDVHVLKTMIIIQKKSM